MITVASAKLLLGAIGNKIPLKWVIYASVASASCILIARYLDEIFTFGVWTLYGLVLLVYTFIVWEASCLWYTRKFDIPGDGIKPIPMEAVTTKVVNTVTDAVDNVNDAIKRI